MITTISRVTHHNDLILPSGREFTRPLHEVSFDETAVEISAILPDVSEDGLEILLFGDQLILTGRRNRKVRPNWEALRLEQVQHDYRLNLRLGFIANPLSVRAELACGILSIRIDRTPVAFPA